MKFEEFFQVWKYDLTRKDQNEVKGGIWLTELYGGQIGKDGHPHIRYIPRFCMDLFLTRMAFRAVMQPCLPRVPFAKDLNFAGRIESYGQDAIKDAVEAVGNAADIDLRKHVYLGFYLYWRRTPRFVSLLCIITLQT